MRRQSLYWWLANRLLLVLLLAGGCALFWSPFIGAVTAIIGILLVSLLLIRLLTYWQAQLEDRLLRLGKGDWRARSPANPWLELAPLTAAFDEMAEALETQVSDLQLEKQQWIALFTGMREGILAVDNEVNLLAMNQAAHLYFGLSDEESIAGRPLFSVVRNATFTHFVDELLTEGADHLQQEMEVRGTADVVTVYRLSGVRFVHEQGAAPGALVVMHDVTRVRRLEEMRKEFVANVSHELKTPITSIKGFIETLGGCLEGAPEQAMRFVTIIAQQAERLNAIVDDLLTLSRLEQADRWVAQEFERKDLAVTTANALRPYEAKMRERNIAAIVELDPCQVYANHRLLEQAIANLIDNAVKYSPDGATVTIRLREEQQHAVLTVRDEGIGIPREHLERIFERFHRVDRSRDRQSGGTGLGLSIVKHIMRVHGGTVTVESQLEKGSTFTLRLAKRTGS